MFRHRGLVNARARWRGPLLALVLAGTAWTAGCADHPAGFQTACDRVSTALDALDHGDPEGAEDALNSAANWIDAAFEDTEGEEREAVEDFSKEVGFALADFGTDDGRQALADAKAACA
jgi:hypothetical protein